MNIKNHDAAHNKKRIMEGYKTESALLFTSLWSHLEYILHRAFLTSHTLLVVSWLNTENVGLQSSTPVKKGGTAKILKSATQVIIITIMLNFLFHHISALATQI